MSERRSVTREEVIDLLRAEILRRDDPVPLLALLDLLPAEPAAGSGTVSEPTTDHGLGGTHAWMPVGAYVASALMAANIECDSGEDVDRFLAELARRGFAIRAEAGTLDVRTDGDGYEIRVWQTHQPSGVVVLKGHPQLGGRYCLTDGGDWPCATARGAIARLAEADR